MLCIHHSRFFFHFRIISSKNTSRLQRTEDESEDSTEESAVPIILSLVIANLSMQQKKILSKTMARVFRHNPKHNNQNISFQKSGGSGEVALQTLYASWLLQSRKLHSKINNLYEEMFKDINRRISGENDSIDIGSASSSVSGDSIVPPAEREMVFYIINQFGIPINHSRLKVSARCNEERLRTNRRVSIEADGKRVDDAWVTNIGCQTKNGRTMLYSCCIKHTALNIESLPGSSLKILKIDAAEPDTPIYGRVSHGSKRDGKILLGYG